MTDKGTLAHFLRSSINRTLPDGWLYLPRHEVSEHTECLFMPDDDSEEDDPEARAAELGFPVEGLDSPTLEDVCAGALALDSSASDAVLVRAFLYYLRFDSFLPSLDAPDPVD